MPVHFIVDFIHCGGGGDMILLIYNEDTGQMERMQRDCHENMPYTTNGVLTVESFRGKSGSRLLWSTKSFLESVSESFQTLHCPFEVTHGFSRVWERFENEQFAHKLGTALTGGQNLNERRKVQLRKDLEVQQDYTWIQDGDLMPSVVHFHQTIDSVSDVIVFERMQKGSVGTSVCALQDALWFLGYDIPSINGIFDHQLDQELRSFQMSNGLSVDGIAGINTWTLLMQILDSEEIRYKV